MDFDLWWKRTRDVSLFIGGGAGIYHETAIAPTPDEVLIVLFGGMMGLPLMLRRDESDGASEPKAPDWRKAPIKDIFPDDSARIVAYVKTHPATVTWTGVIVTVAVLAGPAS